MNSGVDEAPHIANQVDFVVEGTIDLTKHPTSPFSGKSTRARELGITILSEDEFWHMLGDPPVSALAVS